MGEQPIEISARTLRCLCGKAAAFSCSTMDKPREKRVLYVGGLDEEATEDMVCAAFIPFGDIVEVNIPKDFKESEYRPEPLVVPRVHSALVLVRVLVETGAYD